MGINVRHEKIRRQLTYLDENGVITSFYSQGDMPGTRWHIEVGGSTRAFTTSAVEDFIFGADAGVKSAERNRDHQYQVLIANVLRECAEDWPMDHPQQSHMAHLRLAFHEALSPNFKVMSDYRHEGDVFLGAAAPRPNAYTDRIEGLRSLGRNEDCDPADCTG